MSTGMNIPIWIDQSHRMQGDRFVCGDCGWVWPKTALGPPFDTDLCYRCGGQLTPVWKVFPGDAMKPPEVTAS